MGTWGTAISSNDTFADIYDKFFIMYDDGFDVSEITEKLIDQNQETIGMYEDANNFWFALAKAQWECKQLDPYVLERIKTIIETDVDIAIWKELEADDKILKKRKEYLIKFLTQIQTERLKPKARKKKIIRQPIFEKGDCLTFKLSTGNYGGAVVLEAVKDTEYNFNLIAATRINQTERPTEKDFKNAEVLVRNYSNWKDDANIMWYLPKDYKNLPQIDKVSSFNINESFDPNSSLFGFINNFKMWFIEPTEKQFSHEQLNARPKKKITLKTYIKRDSFKYW